jgi:hypothetical protein
LKIPSLLHASRFDLTLASANIDGTLVFILNTFWGD